MTSRSRTSSSARSSAAPSSRSRSPSRRPSARPTLLPRPSKKKRRRSSAPRARPPPPRSSPGPSRVAARASLRCGASTPRRRSRSRCRARAASPTCRRAARAAARTCSSGCRTAERRGDGVLGVAREFCFSFFSCGAAFFLQSAGLIRRRCESCERLCRRFSLLSPQRSILPGTAQRNSSGLPKARFRGCPKLGLKPKAQTSGS